MFVISHLATRVSGAHGKRRYVYTAGKVIPDPKATLLDQVREVLPVTMQIRRRCNGRFAWRKFLKRRVAILFHSFATHPLEAGYDIRTAQELPGPEHVDITMIYTYVMRQPGIGVRSPLALEA